MDSRKENLAQGDMDILQVLGKTKQAVREAGEIIKQAWDLPRRVQRKGRIDLVTETDPAVEEALLASLAPLVDGAAFMAEESTGGMVDAVPDGYTWVIDPLDGTTNFVHGLPFVAISTALCHDGQPLVSVVYNPILDEMFHAARGHGAFLNDKAIKVSSAERLDECVIATGFPYTIARDVDELLGYLRRVLPASQGLRRYGCASLDLAYVAMARQDAFYEIGLKPWDTAGGWLLVEEAGGQVSAMDIDRPYRLGSRDILASNGLVHRELSMLLIA